MKKFILFNKPYGVLSQFSPRDSHPALNDFNLPPKVYPAGRLDRDSEGLLLLTDDGPWIKRYLDPKIGHPRTYLVQVEGEVAPNAIEQLRSGLDLGTYITQRCQVTKINPPENLWERNPPIRYRANIPTNWLSITLGEGKNRQVRRMTAKVGHPTLRLIRSHILNLGLELVPHPGLWVEIAPPKLTSP